jgi:hypothetical protein
MAVTGQVVQDDPLSRGVATSPMREPACACLCDDKCNGRSMHGRSIPERTDCRPSRVVSHNNSGHGTRTSHAVSGLQLVSRRVSTGSKSGAGQTAIAIQTGGLPDLAQRGLLLSCMSSLASGSGTATDSQRRLASTLAGSLSGASSSAFVQVRAGESVRSLPGRSSGRDAH